LRLAVETTPAAGLEIGRVEIDRDGKIVVVTGKATIPTETALGHAAGLVDHEGGWNRQLPW
jgi:hypothetical protein